MDNKMKIHLAGIFIAILVLLVGYFSAGTSQKLVLIYISSFGFLALISVLLALAFPILAVFNKSDVVKSLSSQRGAIGFYAFFFALIHVLLVANFFFNWNISKMLENPYRSLGAVALLVLALLISLPKMPTLLIGNYSRYLPVLAIVALALIVIHAAGIGAIFMKIGIIKVLVILLAVLLIILGLVYRKAGDK